MISHLDHLVLTTRDLDRCIHFYSTVLGMALTEFGAGRKALTFGQQKINLHEYGHEIEPKAHLPVPGSLDLCFILRCSLPALMAQLARHGLNVESGPVKRTGACGGIESVYLRDPDLNLIELSVYPTE